MATPRAFPSIERELSPMFVPPWAAVINVVAVLLGMPVSALAGVNGAFIVVAAIIFHLLIALLHHVDDQLWPALFDMLIELLATRANEDWVA